MVILTGTVTDVEESTYTRKSDGEIVEAFDVWVLGGRNVYKTTGGTLEYKAGDEFSEKVEPRSFKNTDVVTYRRLGRV